ncbi:hypothetical protein KTD18_16030 [Burkholderia multivorans]|uniref:hypothetical protein n=1 Tax=Burkholderia multivorans TaxID=87883 RepID=UPI001C219E75|nr:hypothetical protein [Burkholderia multivorans]MBU9293057.1 hypothetical protein [Burkholderia multivorans]
MKLSYRMCEVLARCPAEWEDAPYIYGPVGRTTEALQRRELIEYRLEPSYRSPTGRRWQWRRKPIDGGAA